MARRGTRGGRTDRYFVQVENQIRYLPAALWHQWLAAGLLVLVAHRLAAPACPGVVWLENGELHLRQDPVTPWINLNCRVIERHFIYDTRGLRFDPVARQREIQRQYGGE